MTIICKKDDDDDDGRSTGEVGLSKFQTNPRDVHGSEIFGNGVNVQWKLLLGGFNPTPLKNDGVKVSWDDDIPNIWKVIKLYAIWLFNIAMENHNV